MARFALDPSVRRFGSTVVGGSPLKLFRLTERGTALLDHVGGGQDVPTSRLTDALLEAGAIHPRPTRPSGATHDLVTVVVPTLGPPRHVPPGAIVVDDGSLPPVPDASIRLSENRGPAAARNAGLDAVTTPFVAFVDADVEVHDGWLDALLGHFADDRVALVAPRVRSRALPGRRHRYEREHSPLDLGPDPARIRAGTRVSYVPAAAIVCRVAALRAVGGFDETLRTGEDVDLVWRLDAAGWRCRYEPAVAVEHEPRAQWSSWFRQRIAYGSSAGPLARRHPGALAPVRASGWSVGAWTLAALGHPVMAAALGVATSAALVRKLPDVPPRAAFGLAATGNLRTGEQLATAIRRAWWPAVALLGLRSRRARRVLVASWLAAANPVRAVDDVAYSLGVWRGAVTARTIGPFVPRLTAWPGKRPDPTPPGPPTEPLPSAE